MCSSSGYNLKDYPYILYGKDTQKPISKERIEKAKKNVEKYLHKE